MAYLGMIPLQWFNSSGNMIINDTRAVAQFIKECMDACVCTHGDPGPQSHASNQP